jgi:hypothetical protein
MSTPAVLSLVDRFTKCSCLTYRARLSNEGVDLFAETEFAEESVEDVFCADDAGD